MKQTDWLGDRVSSVSVRLEVHYSQSMSSALYEILLDVVDVHLAVPVASHRVTAIQHTGPHRLDADVQLQYLNLESASVCISVTTQRGSSYRVNKLTQ